MPVIDPTRLPQSFAGPMTCRACGNTVTWARTRSGKSILMDFRAVPLGDYCIVGINHPHLIVGKLTYIPEGAARFMCHFDTCINKRPRRNPNRFRRTLNEADAQFKRDWDKRTRHKSRAA